MPGDTVLPLSHGLKETPTNLYFKLNGEIHNSSILHMYNLSNKLQFLETHTELLLYTHTHTHTHSVPYPKYKITSGVLHAKCYFALYSWGLSIALAIIV